MKYFIGTGLLSITLFNWCYFTAIKETSLSVAAVLLYTAPVFVIIMARLVFKSPLTGSKLVSLFLTAAGCLFVSGVIGDDSASITTFGILTGLGAGFGYALYSIFGKLAGASYSSLTISFYTFLVTAAALLPFVQLKTVLALLNNAETLLMAAGLGLFPTVFAYYLYTNGLKAADAGTASILSTVEPAVAALMGIVFYNETLTFIQYGGIFLIFTAVILLREKKEALSEIRGSA
jgi:drug/metabolite transporter (DMT)-like permease